MGHRLQDVGGGLFTPGALAPNPGIRRFCEGEKHDQALPLPEVLLSSPHALLHLSRLRTGRRPQNSQEGAGAIPPGPQRERHRWDRPPEGFHQAGRVRQRYRSPRRQCDSG